MKKNLNLLSIATGFGFGGETVGLLVWFVFPYSTATFSNWQKVDSRYSTQDDSGDITMSSSGNPAVTATATSGVDNNSTLMSKLSGLGLKSGDAISVQDLSGMSMAPASPHQQLPSPADRRGSLW